MTIKELKEWLNGLPEEMADSPVVIRDIKEMEEGKIGQKDSAVVTVFFDKQNNRLCFIDPPGSEIVNKIRQSQPAKESTTEEGTTEPTTEETN